MLLRNLTRFFLAIGLGVSLFALSRSVSDKSPIVATAIFLAWNVLPYLVLAFVTESARLRERIPPVAVLVAAFAVSAFAAWVYSVAIFFAARLDAQTGLLFLFIPIWQFAGIVGVAFVTALVLAIRANRAKNSSQPE
jgi:hypothetical protein